MSCIRCQGVVGSQSRSFPTGKVADDDPECTVCRAPVCSKCATVTWTETSEDWHVGRRTCHACASAGGATSQPISFCYSCRQSSAAIHANHFECPDCKRRTCGSCGVVADRVRLCPSCAAPILARTFACPDCSATCVELTRWREAVPWSCGACGKRFCVPCRKNARLDPRTPKRRVWLCRSCAPPGAPVG